MDSSFVQGVLEKLKEPLLPAHLVNFLLSILVIACIANSRAENILAQNVCGFNENEGTCSFASLMGVVALLTATVFTVMELQWEKLASYHRWIYLSEMIISILWSFLFFVSFCQLASNWKGDIKNSTSHVNAIFSITFSFFSILTWGGLGYMNYKGYKEDDIGGAGGMERLGSYMDPVTSSYHQGGNSGEMGGNVV
jgi:hypothetical protein